MPCFAVAAAYCGEQNGLNQMYYFRIFNTEIIKPGHTGFFPYAPLTGEIVHGLFQSSFFVFLSAGGRGGLSALAAEAAIRVAVLKTRGDIITKNNLELDTPASLVKMSFRLDDTSFEKAKITAAIAHTGGNMAQAARLLGITEKTLLIKRKKHGLK